MPRLIRTVGALTAAVSLLAACGSDGGRPAASSTPAKSAPTKTGSRPAPEPSADRTLASALLPASVLGPRIRRTLSSRLETPDDDLPCTKGGPSLVRQAPPQRFLLGSYTRARAVAADATELVAVFPDATGAEKFYDALEAGFSCGAAASTEESKIDGPHAVRVSSAPVDAAQGWTITATVLKHTMQLAIVEVQLGDTIVVLSRSPDARIDRAEVVRLVNQAVAAARAAR